jgi:hypothetical protein
METQTHTASKAGPAEDSSREEYLQQVESFKRDAAARIRRHTRIRDRNRKLRYGLGVPAAALAVVAGSAAVADWSTLVTAVAAFSAAVLSTTLGVIKPEEGRERHSRLTADRRLLEDRAIQLRIAAPRTDLDALAARLQDLTEARARLDQKND